MMIEEVDPEETEFIKQTFESFEAIMNRLDRIEAALGIE